MIKLLEIISVYLLLILVAAIIAHSVIKLFSRESRYNEKLAYCKRLIKTSNDCTEIINELMELKRLAGDDKSEVEALIKKVCLKFKTE